MPLNESFHKASTHPRPRKATPKESFHMGQCPWPHGLRQQDESVSDRELGGFISRCSMEPFHTGWSAHTQRKGSPLMGMSNEKARASGLYINGRGGPQCNISTRAKKNPQGRSSIPPQSKTSLGHCMLAMIPGTNCSLTLLYKMETTVSPFVRSECWSQLQISLSHNVWDLTVE